MLVKDANKKRQSHAWLISQIMREKEQLARLRLIEIEREQPTLQVVYKDYLKLYNLHIKPLMPAVNKYFGNMNEKKKIDHFLQGQDEYRETQSSIVKLPYAGKSAVGHRAKQKALDNAAATDVMAKLKQLDPDLFAQLLKQVGGK